MINIKLVYYGQSCFYVENQEQSLIIDPFITPNPLAQKENIDLSKIKVNYILITHGHHDHVADVENILSFNPKATIISNVEIAGWYAKKGFDSIPLNFGGKINIPGFTVKYVYACHSSSMPDGATGGSAGGFVLWDDSGCFYHAGDTALTNDMNLLPEICPPLDFAILPIGDHFTMGINDAVLAADFINCKKIVGSHYDTFEYIKIDHQQAIQAFQQAGCQLILPDIANEVML